MTFSIKSFWIFQQQNPFFCWICSLFKSMKSFTQQSLTQHSNSSLKREQHRDSKISAKTFAVTQTKSKKNFKKLCVQMIKKSFQSFWRKNARQWNTKKNWFKAPYKKHIETIWKKPPTTLKKHENWSNEQKTKTFYSNPTFYFSKNMMTSQCSSNETKFSVSSKNFFFLWQQSYWIILLMTLIIWKTSIFSAFLNKKFNKSLKTWFLTKFSKMTIFLMSFLNMFYNVFFLFSIGFTTQIWN